MVSTQVQTSFLAYIRGLLIHTQLPYNATDVVIFDMINSYESENKDDIKYVRFVGPCTICSSFDPSRLTISYSDTRMITNVYIG